MRMTGSGIPTNHKISPRLMSNAPRLNLYSQRRATVWVPPRATRGCVEQSWHDDHANDAPIASTEALGSGANAAAARTARLTERYVGTK